MTNPHDASPQTTPAIDEADDLFNFDELLEIDTPIGASAAIAPGAGNAPSFANIDEDAMSAVLGPDPTKASPTAVATSTKTEVKPATPAAPPPAKPAVEAATAPAALAPTPVLAAQPARVRTKPSPLLIGVLALFGLANFALIGLTWKSMSTLQQSLGSRGDDSNAHDGKTPPAATGGASNLVAHERIPSQLDVRPEGEETLDAAHEAIERGDFAGARRLLWGLLAVADRWEPSRRDDLEARATFTIADSYRLEADARATTEAAHASTEDDDGAVHAAEPETLATGGHR
jgi:hypothetical protein